MKNQEAPPIFARQKKGGAKMLQAYCVKCRTKRDMKNPQSKTLKNGRIGKFAKCPVCKTNMFRIG